MKRKWNKLLFVIMIYIFLNSLIEGSEYTIIEGYVKDEYNSPLPGVEVALIDNNNPLSKVVSITDSKGSFVFKGLKSGRYILTASLMGFESIIKKDIVIKKENIVKLEIILQLKEASKETIIVSPKKAVMNSKITMPAQEINQKEFANAPLQMKRFQEILPLVPSVVRGPDGQINMNGARAYENSLLVNGANVTDPITGEFAMEIPIEAIENIQTFTNSYSAEFGKYTGGVVNISTLPGDNQWKIKFNDFIPRPRFMHHTIEGIESFTPRFVLSGPIAPSKLFFSQSLNYNFIRTTFYDLKLPENESIYRNFNSLTQLDYLMNNQNRLKFTLSFFPQSISNLGINQFHPPEVSPLQKQSGWNLGFSWENISDKGALFESIFSIKELKSEILPDNNSSMLISPEGIYGNYFNEQWRKSYRYSFIQNYTFPSYKFYGEHITKIGAEIDYISYSGESKNFPVYILRKNGSISRKILFSGSGALGEATTELTTFIQDNWSINPKLTLDLGLRLDKNFLLNGLNPQPRISFVYLPFNNKSTLIRGGLGLFYDKFPLNAADFLSFQKRTEYYYPNEESSYSITYEPIIMIPLKNPYNLTYNIELDQEVHKNLFLRINYTDKKGRNILIVEPEYNSSNNAYLTLSNKGKSEYHSLELSTRYEFKNNFIIISYIHSISKGDLNDFNRFFGYLQEPIIRPNYYSYLPFDNPNRFLIWGIFHLPSEIIFTPVFEYRTGFPFSALDENQNYIGKINEYRFPALKEFNIRITKDFKIKNYTAQLGVKIFNLFNTFNPRDVNQNLSSPNFGKFYNNILPRQIRGVLEILF